LKRVAEAPDAGTATADSEVVEAPNAETLAASTPTPAAIELDTEKPLDVSSDVAIADSTVVGVSDAAAMSVEAPTLKEPDTAKPFELPSDVSMAGSKVVAAPRATVMSAEELTARAGETKLRTFAPSAAEMVQVTVFGIKNFGDITSATVKVENRGKYNFQIDTKALNGHVFNPKSTITYVKPEDELKFSVVVGKESYGEASVKFEDFHPGGFEGDLVLGTNNEIVAIKLSVVQNGQIQPLAPVMVTSVCTTLETLPVQGAPLAVGPSAPRVVTPEEFQKLCNQPGAAAPVTFTQAEFAKLGC